MCLESMVYSPLDRRSLMESTFYWRTSGARLAAAWATVCIKAEDERLTRSPWASDGAASPALRVRPEAASVLASIVERYGSICLSSEFLISITASPAAKGGECSP